MLVVCHVFVQSHHHRFVCALNGIKKKAIWKINSKVDVTLMTLMKLKITKNKWKKKTFYEEQQ